MLPGGIMPDCRVSAEERQAGFGGRQLPEGGIRTVQPGVR